MTQSAELVRRRRTPPLEFRSAPKQHVQIERGVEDKNEWVLTLPGRMQEIAPDEETQPLRVFVRLPDDVQQQKDIRVILSLHGQGSWPDMDEPVLEALRTQVGMVTVAPLTSRRDAKTFVDFCLAGLFQRERIQQLHADWVKDTFRDKFFEDEKEDFRRGCNVALQHVIKQLAGKRNVELNMLGSSLGGTIAAQLSQEFKPRGLIINAAPLHLAADHRLKALIGPRPPTPEQILENITAQRVLVVRGSQDAAVSREENEAYAKAHPNGRYVEIDGLEHGIVVAAMPSGQQLIKEITNSFVNAQYA